MNVIESEAKIQEVWQVPEVPGDGRLKTENANVFDTQNLFSSPFSLVIWEICILSLSQLVFILRFKNYVLENIFLQLSLLRKK